MKLKDNADIQIVYFKIIFFLGNTKSDSAQTKPTRLQRKRNLKATWAFLPAVQTFTLNKYLAFKEYKEWPELTLNQTRDLKKSILL